MLLPGPAPARRGQMRRAGRPGRPGGRWPGRAWWSRRIVADPEAVACLAGRGFGRRCRPGIPLAVRLAVSCPGCRNGLTGCRLPAAPEPATTWSWPFTPRAFPWNGHDHVFDIYGMN